MMIRPRFIVVSIRRSRSSPPAARRDRLIVIEMPEMKTKNGKIQSVKVQPCHFECSSGP